MNKTKLLSQVNTLSSQSIQLCYHCHKCTSGCPVAVDMQYGPDRILRMLQMGESDRVLASHDIWLCVSCETCGTRCPNEIDIARVMDALRNLALEEGVAPAEPDAVKFHRVFLAVVQNMGRMHEATLFAIYKLWSRNILADMDSGAQLLLKGKIPILPHIIKDRHQIKEIFDKSKRGAGQ
jgi:heterodisulfide reductase subunit C